MDLTANQATKNVKVIEARGELVRCPSFGAVVVVGERVSGREATCENAVSEHGMRNEPHAATPCASGDRPVNRLMKRVEWERDGERPGVDGGVRLGDPGNAGAPGSHETASHRIAHRVHRPATLKIARRRCVQHAYVDPRSAAPGRNSLDGACDAARREALHGPTVAPFDANACHESELRKARERLAELLEDDSVRVVRGGVDQRDPSGHRAFDGLDERVFGHRAVAGP